MVSFFQCRMTASGSRYKRCPILRRLVPVAFVSTVALGGAIQYERIDRSDPVSVQIHVLRIDLQAPGLSLHVALAPRPSHPDAGDVLLANPLDLSRIGRFDWAVNTNPWYGMGSDRVFPLHPGAPAGIVGWAVAEGETRSSPQPGRWSFWLDVDGRPVIGDVLADAAAVPPVRLAVSGIHGLVQDGTLLQTEPDGNRAPRTALGLDRAKRWLTLVVADRGRLAGVPGWREVLDLHELAVLMRDLGCWDALNLDGGGSSILVRQQTTGSSDKSRWEVVNRQSAWIQRALPMVLGIRLSAVGGRHEADVCADKPKDCGSSTGIAESGSIP